MAVWIVARKEMRDAFRTRWFALAAGGFTLLIAGLSAFTGAHSSYVDLPAFGRTAAGLVNLVLLVVPLLGLAAGAISLTGEHERGTLAYLLSHPVTAAEVYLGKFMGLAGALTAVVFAGFGLGGLVLALMGSPLTGGEYGWLALLSALLGLVALGLGCLISALADRVTSALGTALFLWLALALLGDLGLMATAAVTGMGIKTAFFASLLNPLQVFRVAAVGLLQPSLEVLGPVGSYAAAKLGSGLLPVFASLLGLWACTPLAVGCALFVRRDQ